MQSEPTKLQMQGRFSDCELVAIGKITKPLLHIHLEGSIPQEIVFALSQKYNVELPYGGDCHRIAEGLQPRDWHHFRSLFSLLCSLLRTPADFILALVALRHKLAAEGIDYVEIHCSPWKHMQRGLSLDVLGDALIAGAGGGPSGLPTTRFIIDVTRHRNEPSEQIINWLKSAPRNPFVGLGVSGGPDAQPRERYTTICRKASKYGLGVVVHAGELEGVASIKEAVKYLAPHRIAHGVSVLEDPQYALQLARAGMHLEICPTANQRLVVGSHDCSHIRRILDLGFEISLGTDDEFLFDTSLPNEIRMLLNTGVMKASELRSAITAARKVAFASP